MTTKIEQETEGLATRVGRKHSPIRTNQELKKSIHGRRVPCGQLALLSTANKIMLSSEETSPYVEEEEIPIRETDSRVQFSNWPIRRILRGWGGGEEPPGL